MPQDKPARSHLWKDSTRRRKLLEGDFVLSEGDVDEVRQRYFSRERPRFSQLAREKGVATDTIRRAVYGQRPYGKEG